MKYNIYLLSYNNYNNRQVKKLDTINDYINGGYLLNTVLNVNFEYSDGISSKLIINSSYVNVEPDYILVEDVSSRVVDGLGNLVSSEFSRWFIIDSNLIRGNQYEFTVRRDIWVDHFNLCMNSTYFVERGYVQPNNDLIFNNEGQLYSQIKKSQTPLYDETECPWIVGYIPKKLNKTTVTPIKSTVRPDGADYVVDNIENWDYYQYVTSNPNHVSLFSDNIENAYRFIVSLPVKNTTSQGNSYQLLKMGFDATSGNVYGADVQTFKTLYPSTFTIQENGLGYFTRNQSGYENDKSNYGWYNETNTTLDAYIEVMNRTLLYTQPNAIRNNSIAHTQMIQAFRQVYDIDTQTLNYVENNLNGKTIKDTSTGKIYAITLNDRVVDNLEGAGEDLSLIRQRVKFLLNLNLDNNFGTSSHTNVESTNYQISPYFKLKVLQIVLTEVGNALTYLPQDDTESDNIITVYRNHTVDQVYDMFAIPYGSLVVKDGADTYTCNKDIGLSIAQAFVTTLGSDVVYDLQMLPYCPVREYIMSDGTFDITASDDTRVRPIYFASSGQQNLIPLNYVFYCSSSKLDNVTLLHNVNDNLEPYSIQVNDVKKQYNTEMYRLSSPNFASSFEFNPAQNGGVNSFLVSATYKPYNPYIRVRPEFGRMYGEDFRDGRGLILQGDFSVATMSNAWTNYELQNKNYLNSFNREIASMNLQNKVASQNDIANAIVGSIQGTATGVAGGAIAGGIPGAIVGGVAGLGASLTGGIVDVQNNKKLRNDAIDKAKTLFNYQLDNIKALPNTIRNVGCMTIDNVLVPLLEFYQASDDELDTFDKRMQYYGMSVMKVGSILEYLNPLNETFVQGQLLRLLPPQGVNTEADNHLAEEISNEISKGLYI